MGVLMFPTEFDTLMYHLPLVDHWLSARSLFAPDSAHWRNPGNNEILAMWIVVPFSGDFLAALNNLPAVSLLGFSAIELGKAIGVSRPFRHLYGMAVLGNSIVLYQLSNVGNDVASAALLVTCACYGLRFSRRGSWGDLTLYAIALGLLAGVKYYSLGYAGAVWVTVAFLASARGVRSGLAAAGAGLTGLVLFGGYWYFRNWIVSGRPLYPLGSHGLGDAHRPLYPAIWGSTFLGNGRMELIPLAVKHPVEMGGAVLCCSRCGNTPLDHLATLVWSFSAAWRHWIVSPGPHRSLCSHYLGGRCLRCDTILR